MQTCMRKILVHSCTHALSHSKKRTNTHASTRGTTYVHRHFCVCGQPSSLTAVIYVFDVLFHVERITIRIFERRMSFGQSFMYLISCLLVSSLFSLRSDGNQIPFEGGRHRGSPRILSHPSLGLSSAYCTLQVSISW